MNSNETEKAAALLANANRTGEHITALPPGAHPASIDEAHAIQALVVSLAGATIAGWKVATSADGVAMWGAVLAPDVLVSGASIAAARMPLRGVEGEIAFRFRYDLPARAEAYSREEIRAALVAFPAIEIVDTRFESYADTPMLDRLADRMSNGGLVVGDALPGADARDLSRLHVVLRCDGHPVVDQIGGHSRGDPMLPVVDFVRARQAALTFRAGQFITAGTLTGIVYGAPGQTYALRFDGVGAVEVTFSEEVADGQV